MRICIKCHLEKEETHFKKTHHRCNECTAEYMKEYRLNKISSNEIKGIPKTGLLIKCSKCSEEKDCSLYSKNRSKKYGRETACKDCTSLIKEKEYTAKKLKPPALEGSKVCTKCKKGFPMTYFSPSVQGKQGRSSICLECTRLKSKSYRDKEGYQEKQKGKIKKKYIERKVEFFNWLREQSCMDCGNRDFRSLTFDHLYDKQFGIANGVGKVPFEILLQEIAKCEIVCSNCHLIRTAVRGNFYKYLDWYDKGSWKPEG